MAINYGQDLDLGVPNMMETVNVKSFKEVTDKINESISEVQVGNEELKKIKFGVGLPTGTNLDDVEAE